MGSQSANSAFPQPRQVPGLISISFPRNGVYTLIHVCLRVGELGGGTNTIPSRPPPEENSCFCRLEAGHDHASSHGTKQPSLPYFAPS